MTATISIFSTNAQIIMCKRYYLRGTLEDARCEYCHESHETPDAFWTRVSMGRDDYRALLTSLDFLPNSPTLMNLGNELFDGTLSACFKFDPEDTMFDDPDGNGIMATLNKAAAVLRAGGGVGYALSKIRAEGAVVHSTHGKAFGPIGFLRMAHVLAKEITQGGKRDAAQMGILHCTHPDLLKFIHAKDNNPEALSTFNISVAATDEWMQAARQVGTVEYQILTEMAQSAWRTGDPGLYFIDAAERENPTPWLGQLTATNPCGEVPLLNNEPCNLGSINLGHFVVPAMNGRGEVDRVDPSLSIDWKRLREVTRLAVEYLDDVLDRNKFPDPAIDLAARTTRKLGLGVCGWADMLAQLGLNYDDAKAVSLGERVMEWISKHGRARSEELMVEKGMAPAYEGRNVTRPRRNATVTCIAPTGTIAIIMEASSGIEPYFAAQNDRRMGDGTILKEDAWATVKVAPGHTPKVAHDIAATWHLRHQAAFQKNTDLAVSKTVNMHHDATPEDIRMALVEAWDLGCKGVTIFRDGSRSEQVLTSTVEEPRQAALRSADAPVLLRNGDAWRDVLPDRRPPGGRTQKFRVGETEGFITANVFEDGAPAEIFLKLSRGGSTLDGFADWWAQTFSITLQMAHKVGVPFTQFTAKFKNRRFEPSGLTGYAPIPHATSISDFVAKWLELEFGGPIEQAVLMVDGMVCPDCENVSLQLVEGCEVCRLCGYSAC